MAIEYTNRHRQTYYLHQGKGRTGKPNYFFSMSPKSGDVEAVPDGYEIYERPNGQVFLRSVKAKKITDQEIAIVQKALKRLCSLPLVKVEARKNTITVFTIEESSFESDYKKLWREMGVSESVYQQRVESCGHYRAMLQFVLTDPAERIFTCRRYCFRGSIDRWIEVDVPGRLELLANKYVKHLGRPSFYELFIGLQ
jgi:hypothetical protein